MSSTVTATVVGYHPEWCMATRRDAYDGRAGLERVASIDTVTRSRAVSPVWTPAASSRACPVDEGSTLSTTSASSDQSSRMPPFASICLMNIMAFLRGVGLTVVIPTSDDYAERLGAGPVFSGLSIGLVPFLACVGIYINHYAMKGSSMKTLLFLMSCGTVVGNVLYALAALMKSQAVILVARAVIGVNSGSLLVTTYIALTVGPKRRSEVMFYLTASTVIGYAAGPALAALLGVFVKEIRVESLVFDADTAPGWLMAILNFVFLIAVVLKFQDPPVETVDFPAGPVDQQPVEEARLPALGLTACTWTACMSGLMMANCEVFAVRIGKDVWGWSVVDAAWYLAGVMMVVGLMNLLIGVVMTRFPLGSDRGGLLVASIIGCLCCAPLFDFDIRPVTMEASVFAVGLFLVLCVAGILRSLAMSLATKIVPANLKGTMSLLVMASNAAGRGVGALLGAVLTQESFATVSAGLFIFTVGTFFVCFKQLEVHTKAV